MTLTFDLLTLKVVSESCVTWATANGLLPILVFLGLSVLDLGPMYATDRRQTDITQKHRLMPRAGGIIMVKYRGKSHWFAETGLTACNVVICNML